MTGSFACTLLIRLVGSPPTCEYVKVRRENIPEAFLESLEPDRQQRPIEPAQKSLPPATEKGLGRGIEVSDGAFPPDDQQCIRCILRYLRVSRPGQRPE